MDETPGKLCNDKSKGGRKGGREQSVRQGLWRWMEEGGNEEYEEGGESQQWSARGTSMQGGAGLRDAWDLTGTWIGEQGAKNAWGCTEKRDERTEKNKGFKVLAPRPRSRPMPCCLITLSYGRLRWGGPFYM